MNIKHVRINSAVLVDATRGHFAEPEKSVGAQNEGPDGANSRLAAAIERLRSPDLRSGLLSPDRTIEFLVPCYEISWAVDKDESLFDRIVEEFQFDRKPSFEHHWMMPLNAAARPETIAQQKRLSDLSYYVQLGLLLRIVPGAFESWAREIGITACIDGVREWAKPERFVDEVRPNPPLLDDEQLPQENTEPVTREDPGVKVTISAFDGSSVQRSFYVTQVVGAQLIRFMKADVRPEALDLTYALADAIEGRPWSETFAILVQAGAPLVPDESVQASGDT